MALRLPWLCIVALAFASARGEEAARDGFRFVHLSDLHCARAAANPPPQFLFDVHCKDLVHSFDLVAAAVREINQAVKPDFVVVTGDLVDRGADVASLERVKAILDGLACPYYPVIGDHDSREAWQRVFGAARLNYTFACGGWRFVAADASLGRLDAPTMAWLERELGRDAATPTILLTHRPAVVPEVHVRAAWRLYGTHLLLKNAAEALALLGKHPNVRAVLSGHCHMTIDSEVGGVMHSVAPALVEPGHGYHVVEVRGGKLRSQLRLLGQ